MAEDVDDRKARLRLRIREQRAAMSDESRALQRPALAEQLARVVLDHGAKFVSCYYPLRGEPDTLGFLEWAMEAGICVILPSARSDGSLDWIEMTTLDVEPGLFAIPEPGGEPLDPGEADSVDLMFVPACAVDQRGNRLGWGRGYFDRALGSAERRPAVFAVVHDDEILDEVPVERHDIPVTGAVTPSRTLTFR